MAHYNLYEPEKANLIDRFTDNEIGYKAWVEFINENGFTSESFTTLRAELRQARTIAPLPSCPRVFISHRQCDKNYALRIAHLASTHYFDFWLDVLDPLLQNINNLALTPQQISILTAAIIEMALINSTHVLAVMTTNTRGTMWVPYEYGRIADIIQQPTRSSAWIEPQLKNNNDIPEYLMLYALHDSENDIISWFHSEYQSWQPQTQCQPQIFVPNFPHLPTH